MNLAGWLQVALYVGLLAVLAGPIAAYLVRVFDGRPNIMTRVLGPLERGVYRLSGIDPRRESGWRGYARDLLAFNLLGFLAVYGLQRLQHLLPGNPAGLPAVSPDSAFNTAVSFMTNTNWQGYG